MVTVGDVCARDVCKNFNYFIERFFVGDFPHAMPYSVVGYKIEQGVFVLFILDYFVEIGAVFYCQKTGPVFTRSVFVRR